MSAQLTHAENQAGTTRSATAAGRRPFRGMWHRIRLAIQEMNYASRRVSELLAPWSVEKQRRGR
jgi:hypothetical protein